jgi:hypothetical protein
MTLESMKLAKTLVLGDNDAQHVLLDHWGRIFPSATW